MPPYGVARPQWVNVWKLQEVSLLLRTVAADALVLKQQAIVIVSTDEMAIAPI